MITIREIHDKKRKATICGVVLRALPDWFGSMEQIEPHMQRCTGAVFFAAYEEGRPLGFAALTRHTPHAAEVSLIGVLRPFHRQALGSALLDACEAYGVRKGMRLLTVKLPERIPKDHPYMGSKAFFAAKGFLPVGIFPDMWAGGKYCVVAVKVLPVEKEGAPLTPQLRE